MADAVLVYCTFPDKALAATVATALVSEGLAACVNLHTEVISIYRWQGTVHREEEVLAIMKTQATCYAALEARVLELHSYDNPEIIAIPIALGHRAYLDWIAEETQPPSAP